MQAKILLFLCLGGLGCTEDHTDDKADAGRDQPEQVLVEQGKMVGGKVHKRVQMQALLKASRKRLHEVENRGGPGADHHRDIDLAVMVKESADKGKNDQRNRGRINKHQHRDRVFDDHAEAHIGDRKREDRKDDCPDGVGDFAVRHLHERLRAGGHKADGGLEAGERDRDGQNQLTDGAKIMARDLCQGNTAVGGGLEEAAGLCTHENRQNVNDRHENTGQNAGAQNVGGHCVVIVNAHAANDVDDHNAERQTRNRVHRAVALDERREERAGFIRCIGLHIGNRRARMDERPDDEDREE